MIGQVPTSDGIPVYSDGFESGSLGAGWSTHSSTTQGQIQVSGQYGTAGGNYAMLMDTSSNGTYNLNEAVWTVNLAGLTTPKLVFYNTGWADEVDTMPVSFIGSSNSDGVAISADGTTWYRVFTPTTTGNGTWQKVTVDLAAAAANAGITLGANFKIKFQQYDNFAITTDGRGYDEIAINVPSTAPDWYSFTLNDGDVATIAATRYAGTGSLQLDLYNNSGGLLQSGVAGTNLTRYISRFADTTSNGNPDTYFVRVSGIDANYSLLVTRGADFDTEPNNAVSNLQAVTGLNGVLGYVSPSNNDVYGINATAGQMLTFHGILPGAGPNLFDNGLDTTSGSNLRMQLSDPNGTVIATDSSSIVHTAAMTGTYSLRVYSVNTSGEYYIQMTELSQTTTIDSGILTNVTDTWQTITLSQTFTDPIVIVGPMQLGDTSPGTVRIRNVTSSSFQIQVNEWDYLDGPHGPETVSYLVLNRGINVLDNGKVIEAGSASVTDAFSSVNLSSGFASTPVVITTVASDNDSQAVTSRLRDVTASGFSLRVQEEESNDGTHPAETVNYIATLPGIGNSNGLIYEAGLAPDVTHKAFVTNFTQTFLTAPRFLASMQTYNSADTANVRVKGINAKRVSPFIEEERSLDNEVSHIGETVGFMAFRFTPPAARQNESGSAATNETGAVGLLPATTPVGRDTEPDPAALPGITDSRLVKTDPASAAVRTGDTATNANGTIALPDGSAAPNTSTNDWRLCAADQSDRVGFQWYW